MYAIRSYYVLVVQPDQLQQLRQAAQVEPRVVLLQGPAHLAADALGNADPLRLADLPVLLAVELEALQLDADLQTRRHSGRLGELGVGDIPFRQIGHGPVEGAWSVEAGDDQRNNFV